jgi:hypothetical protein
MRTRRKPILTAVALLGLILLYSSLSLGYSYVIKFGTETTTTNFACPLHLYPDVTSAFNQPRTTGRTRIRALTSKPT